MLPKLCNHSVRCTQVSGGSFDFSGTSGDTDRGWIWLRNRFADIANLKQSDHCGNFHKAVTLFTVGVSSFVGHTCTSCL